MKLLIKSGTNCVLFLPFRPRQAPACLPLVWFGQLCLSTPPIPIGVSLVIPTLSGKGSLYHSFWQNPPSINKFKASPVVDFLLFIWMPEFHRLHSFYLLLTGFGNSFKSAFQIHPPKLIFNRPFLLVSKGCELAYHPLLYTDDNDQTAN